MLIQGIVVRQLGARWWKSEEEYILAELDYSKCTDSFIRVGWPAEGGVWVLKTTRGEADKKGAAIIHNAYNMEERCKIIKQLEGQFYDDPRKCPYLDLRSAWETEFVRLFGDEIS